MRLQVRQYMEFIKALTENTNIMTKSFFVVISYAASGISTPASGIMNIFKKKTDDERAAAAEMARRQEQESSTRRNLLGSGDRSDRNRTYNFPQGRVSDHRINLTLYKLDRAMEGDLDDVIEALQAYEAAQQLAALENSLN